VVGTAFNPPSPYGHPTKLVSGCIKQVNPAAVPFTKFEISAILPTFAFDPDVSRGPRVMVTFVKEELSERRGVGGSGV
jgi:hypothetical protein